MPRGAGGLQPPGRANVRPTHSILIQSNGRESSRPSGPGLGRPSAEGEGVEPSRLIARPNSSRVPSPLGLPFRPCSTGGRNRTCELLFNREAHEPAHASPVRVSVEAAGLEPAFSRSRTGRIRHAFPRPESSNKCPAGVEPAHPPWQDGRLPRHHGHDRRRRIVKESESTEWDSNPRRRITGAGSSPLDDRCRFRAGPEGRGLATSPARGRCVDAHACVPSIKSAREELNLRLAVISRLFCR